MASKSSQLPQFCTIAKVSQASLRMTRKVAEARGHFVGSADEIIRGPAHEDADAVAIGCEPDGPPPPVDENLHVIQDVGVELAGQIAKRHAALRHPVGVPKRVHAVGEGKGGDRPVRW